jgi:hypothetical protein
VSAPQRLVGGPVVAGLVEHGRDERGGRPALVLNNDERGPIGQSSRGLGLVLRSTATSWRRTSSSMSLDDAWPSSVSPLRSWLKIR